MDKERCREKIIQKQMIIHPLPRSLKSKNAASKLFHTTTLIKNPIRRKRWLTVSILQPIINIIPLIHTIKRSFNFFFVCIKEIIIYYYYINYRAFPYFDWLMEIFKSPFIWIDYFTKSNKSTFCWEKYSKSNRKFSDYEQ